MNKIFTFVCMSCLFMGTMFVLPALSQDIGGDIGGGASIKVAPGNCLFTEQKCLKQEVIDACKSETPAKNEECCFIKGGKWNGKYCCKCQ